MRVTVFGGHGLLGTALVRELRSRAHAAIPVSRRAAAASDSVDGPPGSVDITDPRSIAALLEQQSPDAVVLAAAATDVDGVEQDPERAFRVNALGARNVADVCRAHGVRLCYISTDYVFDGVSREPYTEFDPPNPINVYGRSKLAGEHCVTYLCPGSLIVRTSYVYGLHGPCFPATILRVALAGKPLRLVRDRTFAPSSTRQISRKLVDLLERRAVGTYHVAGRGTATPLAWGQRLLTAAGLDPSGIQSIEGAEWPSPAARPANSTLRPFVLQLENDDDMEPWQDETDAFAAAFRERLNHEAEAPR